MLKKKIIVNEKEKNTMKVSNIVKLDYYYKSIYYPLNEIIQLKNDKRNDECKTRISVNLKNFQELRKSLELNNSIYSKLISLSFHLSSPEDVIEIGSLSIPKLVTNLVMIFNGFPILASYDFLNDLDLHTLSINMNLDGFSAFWKELPNSARFKTLNIYLHLNVYKDFESLFVLENELIKSVYKKVFMLSRSKCLEGLNLTILFNSESTVEESNIAKLKLKNLLFNDHKYYLGFLELFSLNLLVNANNTYFIYSGFDSKFIQERKFSFQDKSLVMSLKLCKQNDVSIFYALKKKRLGNSILSNVFKFLAKREYTIVNLSQQYYVK